MPINWNPDPSIIPLDQGSKDSKLPKGQFVAKFEGACGVCGRPTHRGEILHFVDNQAAHVDCRTIDGKCSDDYGHGRRRDGVNRFSIDDESHEEREPKFVVRGQRKPPLCQTCWLEHNGDCP